MNDASVMDAWKKDQGLAASDVISFVADTQASLTTELNLFLTGPEKASIYPSNVTGGAELNSGASGGGPNFALGMHTRRCKRGAFLVEDGVIKVQQIAEAGPKGEFDPAGDDFPEVACIENVLKLMAEGQPVGEHGSSKK